MATSLMEEAGETASKVLPTPTSPSQLQTPTPAADAVAEEPDCDAREPPVVNMPKSSGQANATSTNSTSGNTTFANIPPVSFPPNFISRMVIAWKRHNRDFRVILLRPSTLSRHLTIPPPPEFWGRTGANGTAPLTSTSQQRANWVRLAILAEHGGVWIDASVVLTGSLSTLLEPLLNRSGVGAPEAFAFHTDGFSKRSDVVREEGGRREHFERVHGGRRAGNENAASLQDSLGAKDQVSLNATTASNSSNVDAVTPKIQSSWTLPAVDTFLPVYETYFIASVPNGRWLSECTFAMTTFGLHTDHYLDFLKRIHGDDGYHRIVQNIIQNPGYLKLTVTSQRVLVMFGEKRPGRCGGGGGIPLPATLPAEEVPYRLLKACERNEWEYAKRLLTAPRDKGNEPLVYKLRGGKKEALKHLMTEDKVKPALGSVIGSHVYGMEARAPEVTPEV
ncbi:hypothetical protein HDU96_011054 [Phlyctochytrium bullatum]|nr:hypothetical protein HDU96_011054 [Phlyctochytrium bullatum]